MPTLKQIYTALANELGDLATFTATSTGASTSNVVGSSLINAVYGAKHYAQCYLYCQSGAVAYQQSQVRDGGFDPTTGSLTTGGVYSSAPQSGSTWILTKRFPTIRQDSKPGMREFINTALALLPVEDRIDVTGVTNQPRYDLPVSSQWWISEPGRIIGIASPYPNANQTRDLDTQFYDIIWDGETPQLQLYDQYVTGDTFQLIVRRPANSRIKLNAHARATISAGAVNAISVVTGGYYASTPTVTISGGGGSGATATATLTNNVVTSISVGAGGSGYTTTPTVTISAGSYADQSDPTAGLILDTDECFAPFHDVVQMAKELAHQYMAEFGPSEQIAEWDAKATRLSRKNAALRFTRGHPTITRMPTSGSTMSPGL